MTRILVIGCGGFGREVAALLDLSDHELLGFADDAHAPGAFVKGWGPVLGPVAEASGAAIVAVGDPALRQRIADTSEITDAPWIVHPNVWIGAHVVVGDGTVICSGVSITTNIAIGRHVHLNLHCTVGHDTSIGDFVTVAPGVCISGNVSIGDRVEIGTGASILPGVTIDSDAVVGAGAVVTRDVGAAITVVGVPAKPIG